jgi:hypothetical protein
LFRHGKLGYSERLIRCRDVSPVELPDRKIVTFGEKVIHAPAMALPPRLTARYRRPPSILPNGVRLVEIGAGIFPDRRRR